MRKTLLIAALTLMACGKSGAQKPTTTVCASNNVEGSALTLTSAFDKEQSMCAIYENGTLLFGATGTEDSCGVNTGDSAFVAYPDKTFVVIVTAGTSARIPFDSCRNKSGTIAEINE